jgi:hypothetical protein
LSRGGQILWPSGLEVRDRTVPKKKLIAPTTLIECDDNLFRDTRWNDPGYVVAPFLSATLYRQLQTGIRDLILAYLKQLNVPNLKGFELSQYHHFVGMEPEPHLSLIQKIKSYLPISQFPLASSAVNHRVSDILKVPVSLKHPTYQVEVFSIRIVRPGARDYNPLHRDVWIERLRHGVNCYVPLAGSDENSSLPLIPGSHYWPEEDITRTAEGYVDGNVKFSVPAVMKAIRPLEPIRPNPAPNEILLFSPYLIHGGASNLNRDTTRVSLEMRLWRTK